MENLWPDWMGIEKDIVLLTNSRTNQEPIEKFLSPIHPCHDALLSSHPPTTQERSSTEELKTTWKTIYRKNRKLYENNSQN